MLKAKTQREIVAAILEIEDGIKGRELNAAEVSRVLRILKDLCCEPEDGYLFRKGLIRYLRLYR